MLIFNYKKMSYTDNNATQYNLSKKKSLKKVRFYGVVYVILIPSIKDYMEGNLMDKLWWSKLDYKNFQKLTENNNNNSSLKDYCLNMLHMNITNPDNQIK